MWIRLPLATLALIAALAACSSRDPVANDANGAALPEPVTATPADHSGAPPSDAQAPTAAPAGASAAIPAALHGRWGLTPGDCTSTRGDNKGLLTIDADELRFYKSRAVPAPGVETYPDGISGNFSFTGEGQDWAKFQALKVSGNKLVRTETNPATSYAYAKC